MMKGYFSGYSSAAHKGSASKPSMLLPEPRKPMMRRRRSCSSSSRTTQLLIAAGVTAGGGLAHLFKTKNKKWYGIVEMVIDFFSAIFVSGTLVPGQLELAKWSTLAGAAYVIARGLGNRADGEREIAATKTTAEVLKVGEASQISP
jgi:hypothetical protein